MFTYTQELKKRLKFIQKLEEKQRLKQMDQLNSILKSEIPTAVSIITLENKLQSSLDHEKSFEQRKKQVSFQNQNNQNSTLHRKVPNISFNNHLKEEIKQDSLPQKSIILDGNNITERPLTIQGNSNTTGTEINLIETQKDYQTQIFDPLDKEAVSHQKKLTESTDIQIHYQNNTFQNLELSKEDFLKLPIGDIRKDEMITMQKYLQKYLNEDIDRLSNSLYHKQYLNSVLGEVTKIVGIRIPKIDPVSGDMIQEEKQFNLEMKVINNWNENNQKAAAITLTDITSQLQQFQNEKYQQINDFKDHILRTVSHDLKTPLNAIIETITNIKMSKNMEKDLELIKCSSLQLLFIVFDIMDYSTNSKNENSEQNQFCLTTRTIPLIKPVKEVQKILQLKSQEKNISLHIEIPIQLKGVKVTTDEQRLKQILMNLIGNAVKFTDKNSQQKSKIITRINFIKQKGKDVIEIKIKDQGRGMSKEKISTLFKLQQSTFQQKNGNQSGIGLGLTISEQLVSVLGPQRTIEVYSEEGKGSEFTFYIYKNLDQDHSYINSNIMKSSHVMSSGGGDVDTFPSQPTYNNSNNNNLIAASKQVYENIEQSRFNFGKTEELFKDISTFKSKLLSTKESSILGRNFPKGANLHAHLTMVKKRQSLEESSSLNSQIQKQIQEISYKKPFPHVPNLGSPRIVTSVLSKPPFYVLVVDDEAFNVLVLSKILERCLKDTVDFTVKKAYNGEKAIQKVLKYEKEYELKFDIIFMDIQMPVMDGIEATLKLRELEKKNEIRRQNIWICSANYNKAELRQKYSHLDADKILAKPITNEHIQSHMKSFQSKKKP